MACGMMSFIQQDPDTLEPMPGSQGAPGSPPGSPVPAQTPLKALPSTRAGALISRSSQHGAVSVPQIIFLYQLVEGIADKSFGEAVQPLNDASTLPLQLDLCNGAPVVAPSKR